MTETVSLALMALVGMIIFALVCIILVAITLQSRPSCFKFGTKYGNLEVHYDNNPTESDE